jgi:hypothetical protein
MLQSMTRSEAGISIRMGTAMFAIMVWPMCRNSAGVNVSSERVRVNQVPQNTPITKATSIRPVN